MKKTDALSTDFYVDVNLFYYGLREIKTLFKSLPEQKEKAHQ